VALIVLRFGRLEVRPHEDKHCLGAR
jgi:hypothetical protein